MAWMFCWIIDLSRFVLILTDLSDFNHEGKHGKYSKPRHFASLVHWYRKWRQSIKDAEVQGRTGLDLVAFSGEPCDCAKYNFINVCQNFVHVTSNICVRWLKAKSTLEVGHICTNSVFSRPTCPVRSYFTVINSEPCCTICSARTQYKHDQLKSTYAWKTW